MHRKKTEPFTNPWLAMIDSVEKKLMYYVDKPPEPVKEGIPHAWIHCGERAESMLARMAAHPDELLQQADSWFKAGWLTAQSLEQIRRVQRVWQELQRNPTRGASSSPMEEYQHLMGQLMPTLERIHQRMDARHGQEIEQEDDSVEVALRIVMKRREGGDKPV